MRVENQKAVNPSPGVTAPQKENTYLLNYTTVSHPAIADPLPGGGTPHLPSKKKSATVGRPHRRVTAQTDLSPVGKVKVTIEIEIETSPMGASELTRILQRKGPQLWLKHYLAQAVGYVVSLAVGRHWSFKVVEGRVRQ